MEIVLGREARRLWELREAGSFLNHGSYGACPRKVRQAQEHLRAEMESHPDAFMAKVPPGGGTGALRAVASALAPFVGSTPGSLVLVENATTAVETVLRSIDLSPGDEILATDQQYDAVRLAIERRCRATGAVPRVLSIPLPTTPEAITDRVIGAVGRKTRLAVLDHITSPSALRFPVEHLVPELQRRGVRVLIDGAHALGQVPLALDALGADWHLSNAHKWLYAPRGTALLHANPRARGHTLPLQTSHDIASGFPAAFDYIGTRDYTAWLSLPAALDFHRELREAGLEAHAARLVDMGSEVLAEAGARPLAPRDRALFMRAFLLPQLRPATAQDADTVMRTLWERERIQIRCAIVGSGLLLRFCAQAYVAPEEMQRLGEALRRHGWPDAKR